MKKFAMLIAAAMSFGAMATDADTTTKEEAKQEAQQKAEKIAKELQAKKAELDAAANKQKEAKQEDKK